MPRQVLSSSIVYFERPHVNLRESICYQSICKTFYSHPYPENKNNYTKYFETSVLLTDAFTFTGRRAI